MNNNERSMVIGGSDIAAICGVSRFSTPLKIWAEKKGLLKRDTTEAMELGTDLEEFVAQKFSARTGLKVRKSSKKYNHPQYHYMVGHIDRLVEGGKLLECKTTSAYRAKEWEDSIPLEYQYQVNWYLGITGRKEAYICALIGGQKIVIKEYTFDEELYNTCVQSAKIFFEEFLLKDIPPVVCEQDADIIDIVYPIQGESIIPPDTNVIIEKYLQTKKEIAELEKTLEQYKILIKQNIQNAAIARNEHYVITQKQQERISIDTKKLKLELPEVCEKYAKKTEYVTFNVKIVGGNDESTSD